MNDSKFFKIFELILKFKLKIQKFKFFVVFPKFF